MAHNNIAPGMIKAWDKKKVKDNRLDSVWDELSNRASGKRRNRQRVRRHRIAAEDIAI